MILRSVNTLVDEALHEIGELVDISHQRARLYLRESGFELAEGSEDTCTSCGDELGVSPWPDPVSGGHFCHGCYCRMALDVGLIPSRDDLIEKPDDEE